MTRAIRSSRNLPLLVPQNPAEPDTAYWATVTQASPLRIKLDGETSALPFTPITLVAPLFVNDRVRVALSTNTDPATKSRRVIVTGRSGGITGITSGMIADDAVTTAKIINDAVTNAKLANVGTQTFKGRYSGSTGDPEDMTLEQAREILALPNAVAGRFTGNFSSTSTSYADMSGVTVTLVKRHAASKVLLQASGTWFYADGTGGSHLALRVNGTDYELATYPGGVATSVRVGFAGLDSVSGLAAGSYTVQARLRAHVSTKSVNFASGDDYIMIAATEIFG